MMVADVVDVVAAAAPSCDDCCCCMAMASVHGLAGLRAGRELEYFCF